MKKDLGYMKTLTAAQVLSRMRKGDSLLPQGISSTRAMFADGSKVSHLVIRRLIKSGRINRPAGMSIHSAFTLGQND